MEWIVFAKSDSAALHALEADYARRRKKVVAADYHAWGWKTASVAPVLAACRPKLCRGFGERRAADKGLKRVAPKGIRAARFKDESPIAVAGYRIEDDRRRQCSKRRQPTQ
jgi:hypothetical protein